MNSKWFKAIITIAAASVISSMMSFTVVPQAVLAAPLPSPLFNSDDLPVSGWEITEYICDFPGCDPDPDGNPQLWPIHFRLAVNGWAVKVECKQFLTPLPPLGTKCTRNGDIFTCDSPPGTQNTFELIEIIEEPPPPPPPELESFTVDVVCTTPGSHSNDLKLTVTAFNDEGGRFEGADVIYTIEGGPQNGGKTDGNGVFTDTLVGARSYISKSVTVQVGNLDPQSFTITDALFEPCTGRCDSLTGSYDRATDSVSLTVKGSQPGWDAVIRNITLGGNAAVCSGTLDGNGALSCTYQLAAGEWGLLKFNAQVGGSSGPTCQFEVDTPFPAKLIVHRDCPTHGKDSDDMIFWGEMVDQNGQRFTKPITITIKLPNGTQTDVALVNGAFGEITFEDAKDFKGQLVEFFWPEGGQTSFEITKEIFDPCRTPQPTATPPPPQQPRFGADPLGDLPRPQSAEPMIATVSIPYWGFWVPGVVLTAVVLRKRRR